MKAIVYYESRHGNTEIIANAIAKGLRDEGIADVLVMKRGNADEEDFRDRELWVVGSPTKWGKPPFRFKALLTNALKYEGKGKKAATFDTRYSGMNRGAGDRLRDHMEKRGVPSVIPPQCFVVRSVKGPLLEGEEGRAVEYGKDIARKALGSS